MLTDPDGLQAIWTCSGCGKQDSRWYTPFATYNFDTLPNAWQRHGPYVLCARCTAAMIASIDNTVTMIREARDG